KIIIALIITIVLSIVLEYFFKHYLSKNEVGVYILSKDVYAGETIKKEDYNRIKIQNNKKVLSSEDILTEDLRKAIATKDLSAGQILLKDHVSNKDISLEKEQDEWEYVSIEVCNISDAIAYQLKQGDYINIYYTAKGFEADEILKTKEKIFSKDNLGKNMTSRIFEKIKVEGIYDNTGKEITGTGIYKAIIIRVEKEAAMLLSNIKEEGKFTLSLVK
ncbi:MAG: hypothetical protein PHD20_04420, partial [Clostridia bacterium]|nr:hypothetical protein [Clostridia bacterium]